VIVIGAAHDPEQGAKPRYSERSGRPRPLKHFNNTANKPSPTVSGQNFNIFQTDLLQYGF